MLYNTLAIYIYIYIYICCILSEHILNVFAVYSSSITIYYAIKKHIICKCKLFVRFRPDQRNVSVSTGAQASSSAFLNTISFAVFFFGIIVHKKWNCKMGMKYYSSICFKRVKHQMVFLATSILALKSNLWLFLVR